MNFKPIDEISLRHLFSTEYAKSILEMSYIGPCLNKSGKIDSNSDALILDMRKSPHAVKKCKFKFISSSKSDFARNEKFDVAIIWSIQSPLTKKILSKDLLIQNGCRELIVLDEFDEFHSLTDYDLLNIKRNFNLESLKDMILKIRSGLPSVYVLYLASKIYPKRFESNKTVELLLQKFPSVCSMKSQGRGNIVSAFTQTNPPLIKKMYEKSYKWNNNFDHITSNALLEEIIRVHFESNLPTQSEIESVIDTGY